MNRAQVVIDELQRAGDPRHFEPILQRLEATPDRDFQVMARVLRACLARDAPRLESILRSVDSTLLRADPGLGFIASWCRYWTSGLPAVRSEFQREHSAEPLPLNWARERRHLAAWVALLDDRTPRVMCADVAQLQLLPKQPVPVVEGRLNGHRGFFIIDTGAPTSVIALRRAEDFGVTLDPENRRESSDGAGHPVYLYPAIAPRIDLGDLQLHDLPVHVMELSSLGVDGILSPFDALRGFEIELDGRNERVRVSHAASAARAFPHCVRLTWTEGSPLVDVALPLQPRSFLVDTGAGANILCELAAAELGRTLEPSPYTSSATAAGSVSLLGQTQAPWQLGGVEQPVMTFAVKPCVASPSVVFPPCCAGHVGWPWFSSRSVIFSADGRFMHWQP